MLITGTWSPETYSLSSHPFSLISASLTMATQHLRPPTSPAQRWIFTFIYLVFAAVATYYLHLSRAPKTVNIYLEDVFNGGDWQFPGQKTILRRRYTGIAYIDFVASFLVAVFTHGAAGWTKGIKLQQAYFLLQFTPVIATWSIESARKRNARSLIAL